MSEATLARGSLRREAFEWATQHKLNTFRATRRPRLQVPRVLTPSREGISGVRPAVSVVSLRSRPCRRRLKTRPLRRRFGLRFGRRPQPGRTPRPRPLSLAPPPNQTRGSHASWPSRRGRFVVSETRSPVCGQARLTGSSNDMSSSRAIGVASALGPHECQRSAGVGPVPGEHPAGA